MNESKIYFEWSTTVIMITAVIFLTLLSAMLYVHVNNVYNHSILIACFIFILVILISVITQSPVYIKYDAAGIKIKRLIGRTTISGESILTLEKVDDNIVNRSIRKFGSGGFAGYLGIFVNKNLGTYTMCATQKKNLILIKTNRKQYIISCKQYDELINYYAASRPSPTADEQRV
jgi:hypothetical protein